MADLKPTKLVADERTTLVTLYRYHRESLVRKVADLSEADARTVVVGSGTSLLWLVKHCTGAEVRWFLDRFAAEAPDPGPDALEDPDTVASVVAAYEGVWDRVEDVLARFSLEDRARRMDAGDDPVNLRWVLAHMLEETARHAGHADIIREQLDGAVGR